MVTRLLKKIVGSRNDRQLRRMGKVVTRINALEPEMKALLRDRLEQLDNSWPVVVVIFSSLAIAVAWFTIPPGA